MPSGYTAGLTAETKLSEFALDCAQSFLGAGYQEDLPRHHSLQRQLKEELAEYEAQLAALRKMTFEEMDNHVKQSYNNERREIYDRMLYQVNKWQPPRDLDQLKAFMVSQLHEAISCNCQPPRKPIKQNAVDWLKAELSNMENWINYRREQIQANQARYERRMTYAAMLRISLTPPIEMHSLNQSTNVKGH